VGARLEIGGHAFQVARILPSTGSVEDVSVLLPIEDVRGLEGADGVTSSGSTWLRAHRLGPPRHGWRAPSRAPP
jgi:hypothetical protein